VSGDGDGRDQREGAVPVDPVIPRHEMAGRWHGSVRPVEHRPRLTGSALFGVDAGQPVQGEHLDLRVLCVPGGGEHLGEVLLGQR
jgi:hypothetical protein